MNYDVAVIDATVVGLRAIRGGGVNNIEHPILFRSPKVGDTDFVHKYCILQKK